ncbi:hypothetical protein [Streptomyces tubercidicus]|uniref:hypothetical protein n=1 Tax=Streptomyces tubercidicus TaxID=47759 RepID=UPI00369E2672
MDGGGPGLSLPGDDAAVVGDQGLAASAGASGDSAAGPAAPMMPMMPMGGMNAAGGGDREQQSSDASGLLYGSTDPWTAVSQADDHGVGSPYGSPPDEGRLTMPGDGGPAAGPLAGQAAQAAQAAPSGQEPSQPASGADEALDAGLAWMPLLAASAGAGNPTDSHTGSRDTRPRAAEETAAAVWGEPEWGAAGPAAAAAYGAEPAGEETVRPRVPAAPPGQAGARAEAHGPSRKEEPDHRRRDGAAPAHQPGEEAAPGHQPVRETDAPGHQPVQGTDAPGHRSVHESEAPHHPEVSATGAAAPAGQEAFQEVAAPGTAPLDDAAAWDLTAGSLLPLLGPREPAAPGGEAAAADADRQEAAAATAVAAGVYTTARGGTAVQQSAEPGRTAWRPKASGPGPVELTCSFDEPEEGGQETPPESESRPTPAVTGKKATEREEGKRSVADLLRQGEEVWG